MDLSRAASTLPARLVVDLPNWLGDLVMSLPTVERLVAANARGETTLHSRPAQQRLCGLLYPSATVVASPPKGFPLTVGRRLARDRGRHAIGITLRHAYRAKLSLLLAARRRIGSDLEGAWLLSDRLPVDRSRHQVFDAEPILGALGLRPLDLPWNLPLPPVLVEEGAAILARAGVERGAIGLAPAAARSLAKRWPAENFGRLARLLRAAGHQPVVVIGPGEESIADEVLAAAARPLAVVGPDVDVAGLAGVLSHLEVVVCNDSGPMHLAAAVGARVIALFGPTDPRRTAPLGESHVVLSRRLSCAPCDEPCCPLGHADCLRGIPLETVEEAFRNLITSQNTPYAPQPAAGNW